MTTRIPLQTATKYLESDTALVSYLFSSAKS